MFLHAQVNARQRMKSDNATTNKFNNIMLDILKNDCFDGFQRMIRIVVFGIIQCNLIKLIDCCLFIWCVSILRIK